MTFRQFAFNNVFRNKRTYAAYFLSSAFSVMIFFVYAMFIFHPGIQQGLTKELAVKAMTIAEYIIFVFSFFFILYSVGAFLTSRKKEFGILMMHGMSQRQLNRLVFLENMIIGCASMLTGIMVGMLFSKAFLLFGANVLGMGELPFYLSWKPLVLTIVAFSMLFLVISMCTAFFVRGNKVLELLQGGQKPKKEPKSSLILSLLAASLLGTAYYLSVTTTMYNIGPRFLPVVLMTIIGTYFLFTQLSVYIIRLLTRNRHIFYKKTNLIILSDLAYRLKDNARMFFLVAIVSTVAFCGVGTLASMGVFTKEFAQDYPWAISYISEQDNTEEAQHLSIIEHDLQQQQLTYEKIETNVLYSPTEEVGRATLVKLSDYNQMAALLGYPTQSVEEGKAFFIPFNLMSIQFRQDEELLGQQITFTESNLTVHIQGMTDKPMFSQATVGYNILLVSDSMYQALQPTAEQETYIGYKVSEWQATTSVGEKLHGDWEQANQTNERPAYRFSSAGFAYTYQKQISDVMLFVALMVGSVFFIAAGSFLYFRLYTDLEQDQQRYNMISKIGLTEKELRKITTTQLILLFFVPIVVAVIHSIFAFTALQSMFHLSIAWETVRVLAGFFLIQILYFFLIRSRYFKHLKEAIV